jgi:PPM family protein phosphatase
MECQACGTMAGPGFRFCEACGAPLDGATVIETAPVARQEVNVGADLAAVSDRGLVRRKNEDAVALARTMYEGVPVSILVVCDGVSASHNPELGSRVAAEAAAKRLAGGAETGEDAKALLHAAIVEAHQAVCAIGTAGRRPLTTIVAALVQAGAVTIGWAGDSRAYILSSGDRLLTQDDSWVNWVVERGEMPEEQAARSPDAHAIVQCLGDPEDAPEPHVVTAELEPGDKLLLCSDGLWNYARGPSALAALAAAFPPGTPAIDLCRNWAGFANRAGGHDNITAAVLVRSL